MNTYTLLRFNSFNLNFFKFIFVASLNSKSNSYFTYIRPDWTQQFNSVENNNCLIPIFEKYFTYEETIYVVHSKTNLINKFPRKKSIFLLNIQSLKSMESIILPYDSRSAGYIFFLEDFESIIRTAREIFKRQFDYKSSPVRSKMIFMVKNLGNLTSFYLEVWKMDIMKALVIDLETLEIVSSSPFGVENNCGKKVKVKKRKVVCKGTLEGNLFQKDGFQEDGLQKKNSFQNDDLLQNGNSKRKFLGIFREASSPPSR